MKYNKIIQSSWIFGRKHSRVDAVGNYHYMMGETTDKIRLVIQVLSEEIRINHLVVDRTIHQHVYFYQIILDISSQQITCTVTTQDVNRSGLDAFLV